MVLVVSPELKKITTFVRRAEELDRDKSNPESRVVAYYCRQFAVQTGIPLATAPAGKKCLGELLGQLETEKAAMSVFSKDESRLICRRFADKIFQKADAEDRAGAADKGTARTFYAAASFFEILQQFYDVKEEELKSDEQKEEDEKRVYCKWKATEILKAIREGRTPEPGGYGESVDDAGEGTTPTGSIGEVPEAPAPESPDVFALPPAPAAQPKERYDEGHDEGTEVGLNGAPHAPTPPPYPGKDEDSSDDGDVFVPGVTKPADADAPPAFQPPPASAPVPPPPMPAPSYAPPPAAAPPAKSNNSSGGLFGFGKKLGSGGRVSKAALTDATELTNFALAALQEKDADLAAERLQQALKALGR